MKTKKNTISVVAMFNILGEIDIQRGYGKPRVYRSSWERQARLRRTIMSGYLYHAFSTFAFERYTIDGRIEVNGTH